MNGRPSKIDEAGKEASLMQTEQTVQGTNLRRSKRRSPSPSARSNSPAQPSSSSSPNKRSKVSAGHLFQKTLRLFRQSPSPGRTRPLSSSLELPRRHERQKSVELHLTASLPELQVKYFRAKMAFGFNQSAGSNPQAHPAPDLEEIQTEAVGFLAIAGENKVRILPRAWPSDALPPTTSSLLSIASRKGLLAAAGVDSLILARTESVRQAFTAPGPSTKTFEPQLSICVPRVSQVVFTADENVLVISAEDGGGLAVYEVHSLLQGIKKEIFQLGTNGMSIRALVPNPMPESAEYLAAVTNRGQLMLANLKTRELVVGPNGPILKDNVSCVSWSAKGKQLIAGLGDGTAYQMTPNGENKASIPRPPAVEGDIYVSSISWLANDDFLMIYMQATSNGDSAPDSAIFLVHREKGTLHYSFHKLPDPCPPFGMKRLPPHHFIVRLRDFKPNLNDALLVASTAAGDVGLLTRSESPLSSDLPADKITNTYTTTTMAVDSRRAQLPVTEEMTDTSPIGVALDLSSNEKVASPIPTDEMEASSTPLPNLMILNNEGILCSWWFVYNDSIRQGTVYQGLNAAGSAQSIPAQGAQQPSFAAVSQSGFGSASQKPVAATSFGAVAFGLGSSFGSTAVAGATKSPWGTPSAAGVALQTGASSFGKPAFGSTAPIGGMGSSPFGATSSLGTKASPWAASNANNQNQSSSFARSTSNASGGGNIMSANSFSSFGSTGGDASPFANVTNKPNTSSFGALGQQTKTILPAFASTTSLGLNNSFGFGKTPEPSFGSTVTMGSSTGGSTLESGKSIFGAASTNGASSTPFAQQFGKTSQTEEKNEMVDIDSLSTKDQKENKKPSSLSGFTLNSQFKEEASSVDNPPKPHEKQSSNFFGSDFSRALENAQTKEPETPVKSEPVVASPAPKDISTTPASPPRSGLNNKQDEDSKTSPLKASDAQGGKSEVQESDSPTLPQKAEPAPFPPSPTALKPVTEEVPPLAGSPGVSIEAPSSSPSSPVEEESEEDEEDEDEKEGERIKVEEREDEDDDGIEIRSNGSEDELEQDNTLQSIVEPEEAPLPPDPLTVKSKGPAAGWSFESIPKSPKKTVESSPAVSALRPQQQSTTPYGRPKASPVIPPPSSRILASPRSPSPVTSTSATLTKPSAAQLRKPTSQSSFQMFSENALVPMGGEDLSDDEDEKIREELAKESEPTLQLAQFVAHQDYVGKVTKEGIPGQIERVYRDINSMIDILGLNAKSVAAFIKGHSETLSNELTRDDLLEPSLWRLRELEDFKILENLGELLEDGRLSDSRDKINALSIVNSAGRRLRAHAIYNRRALQAHLGRYGSARTVGESKLDHSSQFRHQITPLPPDAAAQQARLRRAAANLQKQLAAAEEAVTVLRAQLASTGSSGPQPTVDAVSNTIHKMTAMAAQKSADIDWLETQLRRLGLVKASTSVSASSSPAPSVPLLGYDSTPPPQSNSMTTTDKATPPPYQAVPFTPPRRVGGHPGNSNSLYRNSFNPNPTSVNSMYSNNTGKAAGTPFATPPSSFRTSRAGAASASYWSGKSASTTTTTSKSYGLFYTPDEGRQGSISNAKLNGPRIGSGDAGTVVDEALNLGRLSLGGQQYGNNNNNNNYHYDSYGQDHGMAVLKARKAKKRFIAERLKEGVEKEGVRVTIIG